MQYSIILTVHNKEFLIKEVVEELLYYTTGHFELIFVIDGCSDRSYPIIHDVMSIPANRGHNHSYIFADNIFETKANNLGLIQARGQYSIIVQDDMIVKEHGWNERLAQPCKKWNDIFAVTARAAHNWIINPNSRHIHDNFHRNDCWCDIVSVRDVANSDNIPRNNFVIRRSVNRGPLLLRSDILKKLNYLDESFSPQDMDDHDLCYRAYRDLGMKAGYYGIKFESKEEWGGTRENGSPKAWLLESHHKNMKIFFDRHKDNMNMCYNETRVLE